MFQLALQLSNSCYIRRPSDCYLTFLAVLDIAPLSLSFSLSLSLSLSRLVMHIADFSLYVSCVCPWCSFGCRNFYNIMAISSRSIAVAAFASPNVTSLPSLPAPSPNVTSLSSLPAPSPNVTSLSSLPAPSSNVTSLSSLPAPSPNVTSLSSLPARSSNVTSFQPSSPLS